MAVEGVHFRRQSSPPGAIGHKALAAALSDLAAMAAAPGEAYVQLGVPEEVGEGEVLEIADGIAALAGEHGLAVLGGDLSASPVLILAITVVGHATGAGAMVRRSGAEAGDAICVTGELGAAAAGLLLLERPELGEAVEGATAAALVERQLRPAPRLAAGAALAAAGARAMIDLSDGLAADAGHLAAASRVRIELEAEAVPVGAGVAEVEAAAGAPELSLATAGGEDYELLVALEQDRLADARGALERLGLPLTRLGAAAPGAGSALVTRAGEEVEQGGFDHLRARARGRASPS